MSDMNNDSNPRERNARTKAQSHFETADARTALVKQIVDAENKARDVKTAKLRALRLAKEEADRAEALANPKPPAPVRAKRRSAR
jgi:hypothetical protein